MKKTYNIDQSALYNCRSKKKLSKLLNIDLQDLIKLSKQSDKKKYITYQKRKKNSTETRPISAPSASLKKVQRRIFKLLKRIDRPDYLMAGEKGKSTLKNAHKHLKNNQILKLDMSNFYPNCTREYIYSFFNKKMQCSPDVSELLCNLLLYNNGLCQGSSPSMVLSFFAYQDMFFEINKIVSERGLIMTTWVDDITISGPDNFNNKKITSLISKVVHAYGHKIKNNKVNFSRKNSAKRVTGIIIDKQKKLKVPNRIRSEIIQLFKIFKINPTKEMKSKLIGKINFAQSIEKNVFEELKNQINSINITN